MLIITSLLAAAIVGPLALRYGAESRPGFDERPQPRQPRVNI